MLKPELSIVLPAYSEARNLELLLPHIQNVLKDSLIEAEILVVDRRESKDSTQSVCQKNGTRYLARIGGDGFGDAIRTGIDSARADTIIFMDADGTQPPELIPELYKLRHKYDAVIGSCYVTGGRKNGSLRLELMSRLVNRIYALLLSLPYKDLTNNFRLFKSAQLQSLILNGKNFDILPEMLFQLLQKFPATQVGEVPVVLRQRVHGKSRRKYTSFVLSYLLTLLRLRFKG